VADSGFDNALWDGYAPFFAREEDEVYPSDRAEESFYANLRLQRPGPCLELGAGHGRLAGVLSREGLLFALEPSRAMLGLWSAEASSRALRVRALAEMPPFLDGAFRLVLFPYNGYHCILDRRMRVRAMSEAKRMLGSEGLFCMEVCPMLAAMPEERSAKRYDRTATGGPRLVEDVYQDLRRDLVVFDMDYRWADGGRKRLVLELARLSSDQVVDEAEEAGLRALELWGDYDRSEWVADSPRLLLLAE